MNIIKRKMCDIHPFQPFLIHRLSSYLVLGAEPRLPLGEIGHEPVETPNPKLPMKRDSKGIVLAHLQAEF